MIACAAISARALVEAAAADGVATVALDLFGDIDTCRHAEAWWPIGEPATLHIERAPLLAALERLAREDRVMGWIAGSGFDGAPALLAEAAARLPLLGTPPAAVQRLRDPRPFFAALDALEITHPAVRFEAPPGAETDDGWLLKDAGSCGGWGVSAWHDAPAGFAPGPGHHWQRHVAGLPMSATFIGNGREAVLLGINRQLVQEIGAMPFAFAGIVGPVPVAGAVRHQVMQAIVALTAEFGVIGLASLDFLLDGEQIHVLELNARPPASLVLYPRLHGGGPFRAHLRACLEGRLPPPPAESTSVRGQAIVYADRAGQLDAAAAARIAAFPGACDLPRAGARFQPGEPLCSVAVCAEPCDSVDDLIAALAQRSATLRTFLETLS